MQICIAEPLSYPINHLTTLQICCDPFGGGPDPKLENHLAKLQDR